MIKWALSCGCSWRLGWLCLFASGHGRPAFLASGVIAYSRRYTILPYYGFSNIFFNLTIPFNTSSRFFALFIQFGSLLTIVAFLIWPAAENLRRCLATTYRSKKLKCSSLKAQ